MTFIIISSLVSEVTEQNEYPGMTDCDCVFEDLDAEITIDEITKAIHELKREKSHGPDCFLN